MGRTNQHEDSPREHSTGEESSREESSLWQTPPWIAETADGGVPVFFDDVDVRLLLTRTASIALVVLGIVYLMASGRPVAQEPPLSQPHLLAPAELPAAGWDQPASPPAANPVAAEVPHDVPPAVPASAPADPPVAARFATEETTQVQPVSPVRPVPVVDRQPAAAQAPPPADRSAGTPANDPVSGLVEPVVDTVVQVAEPVAEPVTSLVQPVTGLLGVEVSLG